MRKPKQGRGLKHILIATGIAVAALSVVATVSEAQRSHGGGFRTMSGPRTMTGPTFRASEPRFQRFNNPSLDNAARILDRRGKGKGKGKGTDVATGEPGRTPPGRRPPGKRPPGWGPPGSGGGVVIIGPGGPAGPAGPGGPGLAGPSPGGPAGGLSLPRAAVHLPPPNEQRFVKDEVVLEFAGNVPAQQVAPMLARYGLRPIDSVYLPLSNSTYFRWKIADRRSVRSVLGQMRGDRSFLGAQANFIFRSTQQAGSAAFAPPQPATPRATPAMASSGAKPAAGDPAQYALAKLRLGEAHGLATGNRVLVAVIDSGIDLGHPELQGVVAGSYDALGKSEGPHAHGTAIAGAIASRARLLGVAPAARILAIRAFGSAGTSGEATTFAIIKGLQYATAQRARVINMSFAGPQDPGLGRQLAIAKNAGAVLIAASGNFGPKSPPQYPAADPNVIAVSATDADDKLFRAANRGRHIAVTAPGVDILLPAPNADYQLTSGTSFAAAHVSGIAALILERKPDLTPDAVRAILTSTARDIGRSGRDDEFGAGLVDAYQAIVSLETGNADAPPAAEPGPVTAR
jgi:hypothetical protein